MDFNQLMARMRELDQPVSEQTTNEMGCGGDMPPAPSTPPSTPPSMSINMNAQGMDNISDILKLIAKVNPDMAPKEPSLPAMSAPPSIMSITPSEPPLKMLPDFDADNDGKPGGEIDLPPDHDKDHIMIKTLDKDGDGDHDMDDHDAEKKKDEWANSPNGAEGEPEIKGLDAAIPDGNDIHKPKKTFPKVAGGDNPMQKMESGDLRAQIRAELMQRLAEAKKS